MMTKNDANIIESLIRGGASSEEILAEVEKVKAKMHDEATQARMKEEAEKKKTVKRDAARTKLIEAVINYALEFDWVEKKDIQQDDIDMLDKALRAEEKVLDNAKEFSEKLFKGGTVSSDHCKCGDKCDAGDCSQSKSSKSSKSLIDQISELLKQ